MKLRFNQLTQLSADSVSYSTFYWQDWDGQDAHATKVIQHGEILVVSNDIFFLNRGESE